MPKSKPPSNLDLDLNLAVAHGLRPDWFCRDRLGFVPDEWQAKLLRSKSRQVIMNCGRQVGKSTTIAALATHTAIYTPGGLILVIAPSQRQSRELFIKINSFLRKLEPSEPTEEETRLTLMLANGSRIIALPGDNPRTVRGYSAPALVVEDEAAFVDDRTYDAIIPMLAATTSGRIVLMSTPFLSAGHFYTIWHNGDGGWERHEHPTTACARVDPDWLDARKREDPLKYDREYLCRFGTGEGALFTEDLLDAMVRTDFKAMAI
jgi:Terminase large subunit, T4likevirus-type, N-terminal